tara:strand:- start:4225 stop:4476 length:252 start_codon:yes stop_codon:yes gene_type:complete
MSSHYDYAISTDQYITGLNGMRIGDLVWWGSVINIGKKDYIGIIIEAQWDFGYNKSVYKIYTNNHVVETNSTYLVGDIELCSY